MEASGSRAAIRPIPRATAGPVSLLAGSAKIFSMGQGGGQLTHGLFLQFVGKDENVLSRDESLEPVEGLGEESAGAEQVEELLRFSISAEWPEAGSAATRQDQGIRAGHAAGIVTEYGGVLKAAI